MEGMHGRNAGFARSDAFRHDSILGRINSKHFFNVILQRPLSISTNRTFSLTLVKNSLFAVFSSKSPGNPAELSENQHTLTRNCKILCQSMDQMKKWYDGQVLQNRLRKPFGFSSRSLLCAGGYYDYFTPKAKMIACS